MEATTSVPNQGGEDDSSLTAFLKLKSLSIEQLCNTTPVSAIAPSTQKVITLPHTSTIDQAISTLAAYQILSAPVRTDDVDSKSLKHRYAGFVDMFDILSYLLSVVAKDQPTEDPMVKLHTWVLDKESLARIATEFGTHSVQKCVGISKHNPFTAVPPTAKLSNLIYLLKKGIHRVAVVENSEIVNIVSQSNVIQFLAQHIANARWGAVTLDDVNLASKVPVLIHTNARAVHAFQTMFANGISAVPIVDKNGILVATLSVSDLRALTISNFSSLLGPVLEFIANSGTKQLAPITITAKDTVETAILKLAATRVHRLWVVDDWGRPTSVLSITDILNFLDLRIYAKEEDAVLEYEANK